MNGPKSIKVSSLSLACVVALLGDLAATPSMAAAPPEVAAEARLRLETIDGFIQHSSATLPRNPEKEVGPVCLWVDQNGNAGAGDCDAHSRHLWWRVQAKLKGVYHQFAEFEVRTERFRETTMEAAVDEVFLVGIGEHRTLDFQRSERTGAGPLTASLALHAQRHMAPELAHEPLGVGLWMVHEAADGRRNTQPLAFSVKPGTTAPFAFGAFRLPATHVDIGGEPFEVLLSVDGSLNIWPQGNGTRTVALAAQFSVAHNQALGVSGRGTGRKVIELEPGQAVEVTLPKPNTIFLARRSRGKEPLRWVTATDDPSQIVHRVDVGELLDGHRFYLVVEAR